MVYVCMLLALYLLSISATDACTFKLEKMRTKNSAPAKLTTEQEIRYDCVPVKDQEETVLLMEFEQIEGDSSRMVLEPWVLDYFRFACQEDTFEWYMTSTEGFRRYLKKVWCSGYKKENKREDIIEEMKRKITKSHEEL